MEETILSCHFLSSKCGGIETLECWQECLQMWRDGGNCTQRVLNMLDPAILSKISHRKYKYSIEKCQIDKNVYCFDVVLLSITKLWRSTGGGLACKMSIFGLVHNTFVFTKAAFQQPCSKAYLVYTAVVYYWLKNLLPPFLINHSLMACFGSTRYVNVAMERQ